MPEAPNTTRTASTTRASDTISYGFHRRIPAALLEAWSDCEDRALLLEGGACRSAVALGAAVALYQCDDLPKPRRIWTSSAGALIAVHLELGAWERGVRLMLDAPEVISFSPRRLLSGRIFDLDDLFARVDLPWSALATTTADIQVAVTCARTGEILHYGLADDVAGAPALVRASMILPGGCGPPVFSKGRPLIDGAPGALPVDAIGARAAVAFALLCWPQGYRSPRTSLLEWLFAPWWSRGIDRRARKAFLDRGQTDVRARDIILGRAPDPRCPTAWIPIAATHERLPGKACRQRAVLAEAIEQGARRFVSAVYGDAPPPQTRAFLKELTAVCRTSQ